MCTPVHNLSANQEYTYPHTYSAPSLPTQQWASTNVSLSFAPHICRHKMYTTTTETNTCELVNNDNNCKHFKLQCNFAIIQWLQHCNSSLWLQHSNSSLWLQHNSSLWSTKCKCLLADMDHCRWLQVSMLHVKQLVLSSITCMCIINWPADRQPKKATVHQW